jgi:hypothetical protein
MQISIVMPVHGDAPYLQSAIQSVASQELEDWELLIVLDRPSQALLKNAQKYISGDCRMKLLSSVGAGIVDALNFGVASAQGDFIARIDSDDMMHPKRLNEQLREIVSSEKRVCVGSQMTFVDSTGAVVGHTNYPTTDKEIKSRLNYQNCIGHPSVIFRKSSFIEVGGYRKSLTGVEDYDLWLRLGRKGSISNLDFPYTRYRISEGQYSKTFGASYTVLENAARIDSIFPFVNSLNVEGLSTQRLTIALKAVRRSNFMRHPWKVLRTFQGDLVSKLIRVRGREIHKATKLILCFPLTLGLLVISPTTLFKIIKSLIKDRGAAS